MAGALAGAPWTFGLRSRTGWSTRLRLCVSLFVLLLVPEWLEAELMRGHDVDLFGHALPATVTVVAALLILAGLEARRSFTALRDAFG